MIDGGRIIIGFTFRVSVEGCGISPAALREVVQRHVDDWNDGRRPLSVEVALAASRSFWLKLKGPACDGAYLPQLQTLEARAYEGAVRRDHGSVV